MSSISFTRTPTPGRPGPALSEAQADVSAPSASAHEPRGSCPPARLSSHLGGPEPRESDAGLEKGRSSTINRSKSSTAKGSDQTEGRGCRTHWTEKGEQSPHWGPGHLSRQPSATVNLPQSLADSKKSTPTWMHGGKSIPASVLDPRHQDAFPWKQLPEDEASSGPRVADPHIVRRAPCPTPGPEVNRLPPGCTLAGLISDPRFFPLHHLLFIICP